MSAIGTKMVNIASCGKEHLAEVVEQPDEEPADERALQAAQPSDDDHHEGEQQHLEVGAGIDAEQRTAEHAAERGQQGAEREDGGEEQRDVDSQRARDLLVVDARPQHRAEARSLLEPP